MKLTKDYLEYKGYAIVWAPWSLAFVCPIGIFGIEKLSIVWMAF